MNFFKKNKDTIIKVISQIAFFIWIPESFATSLFAIKSIVSAIAMGNLTSIPEALLILAGTCLSAIIFGRYYCGYICSFGAMQDLLHWGAKHAYKSNNLIKVPEKADRILSKLKYLILLAIILLTVIGNNILGIISPWTAFGSLLSIKDGSFEFANLYPIGLVILLLIIVFAAMKHRVFCRYFCPVGAVYSIISRFSHDKRSKECSRGGDCCTCQYKCNKHKINYPGLILTWIIFIAINIGMMVTISSSYSGNNSAAAKGPYKDGVYTCSGKGYRGQVNLTVTIENGYISSIDMGDYKDDKTYMNKVINQLLPNIIEKQSTDVDTVSGATYSSKGVIEAVNQVINTSAQDSNSNNGSTASSSDAKNSSTAASSSSSSSTSVRKVDLSNVADGDYEGTANGFRGEIKVKVTVKNHSVEAVRIVSYYDNEEYLFHSAPAVIDEVVNNTELNVDAVSGATYSANGVTQAIENALGLPEGSYTLLDARARADKEKEGHHQTQKFIESDQQYQELVEKYKTLKFGADGKKR